MCTWDTCDSSNINIAKSSRQYYRLKYLAAINKIFSANHNNTSRGYAYLKINKNKINLLLKCILI